MEFLEVDGSQGEGGGQILRTAMSFAAILSRPVRVSKVRAGRAEPGLKRQHVSTLRVLKDVFGGELNGAREGSTEVTFAPGKSSEKSISVDMGTAASITLVLQAVVPAVAISGRTLSLQLVGGTDVPWSPTFDYFSLVVKEAFLKVGIQFEVESSSRGYYPKGGGKIRADISPCKRLSPIDMTNAPEVVHAAIYSRCGRLPRSVAERQLASASDSLLHKGIETKGYASEVNSVSPGTSVLACHTGPGAFFGGDSIGARGKPAEQVGREAADRFVAAAGSGATVDSNLADMLVPLLSMADGPSTVKVPQVTQHLLSGLQLVRRFNGCDWRFEGGNTCTTLTMMPGHA